MRVATVDIGTNSVNLLVADATPTSAEPLAQDSRVARLGQGVDDGGNLDGAAIERVAAIVEDYYRVARTFGAPTLHCTATSAVRDARNRHALRDRLAAIGDVELTILSGEDEARWSFLGALSGLQGAAVPASVLDIGGGSTEFIIGRGAEIEFRRSLNVGSVRFTERYLQGQPPSPQSCEAMRAALRDTWKQLGPPRVWPRPFVAVAGTATSLAAVDLGIRDYDGKRVDGHLLSAQRVSQWRERLEGMTAADILLLAPGVLRGREDVFFAGVSILEAVAIELRIDEIRVSDRGLRYGWAMKKAGDAEASG